MYKDQKIEFLEARVSALEIIVNRIINYQQHKYNGYDSFSQSPNDFWNFEINNLRADIILQLGDSRKDIISQLNDSTQPK